MCVDLEESSSDVEESDSSDDSPVQSPKREKPKKHKPVGKQATNTNHSLPQGGGLGDRGGGDLLGNFRNILEVNWLRF